MLEVNVDCDLGAAQKCTTSEFRSALTDAVHRDDIVVLRPLGSPVQMAEMHSSQSMMGDIFEEVDLLTQLKQQYDDLANSVSLLKQRINHHDYFIEDGKSLAVRAFCDKILWVFFLFAGVNDNKTRWLVSPAAQEFVNEHSGDFVPIAEFGGGFHLSDRVLQALRSLRTDSSSISSGTCHSSSPIKVAIAAQELIQFKSDVEFHWLFKEIFKIGASEMTQSVDAGVGDSYKISFAA